MRRSFLLWSTVIVVACTCFGLVALAENPAWPNRTATRDGLSDPANWPDDPGFGFDILGATEPTGDDNGGEWVMWSWVPPTALTVPGFRREEEMMGAGMHIDRAWQRTTGDPRVRIAVLDCGIKWDERDQRNKWYLNAGELPEPQNADGASTPDVYDLNGDAVFNMRDWDADPRVMDLNGNGFTDPQDLIQMFSDGVDDDANGYTDDISGWDFFQDDNDPEDETRFGHGTGEARDSGSEGNNGIGTIGVCPRCTLIMVRAGDSFVVDVQDYSRAVVFAVDSGASVIQEALGAVNHSTLMRRAQRYAYENGVAISASAADENSRHHNFPGTSNHVMYVHAIRSDENQPQTSTTFLNFNTCTNYGGQLMMSVSGDGCSSEAVGRTAGMSGLLYSAAISPERPGGPLTPPLSAEEVRQLFIGTVDDINIPESQPDHPDWDESKYPSGPGWDQRFGYGRPNARNAVDAIWEGRIPPEVQIETPIWFDVLYPDRTPTVSLTGIARARRAPSFDLEVAYALGIEPGEDDFEQIRVATGLTEPIEGDELASWDIRSLEVDNPGEVENRYSVTLRVRVTAHYGGSTGDVVGEHRKVVAIHRDPSLLPGFPVRLGTAQTSRDELHAASGESSPKLVDVDGDGNREIVIGDADGWLHLFDEDGSELAGWPQLVSPLRGLSAGGPVDYRASAGYASGAVPFDDAGSSILATPAVADLDGDGEIEIVVATYDGDVSAYQTDGSVVPGFPVALPEVRSDDTSPTRKIARGVFGSPVLEDLDDDGRLEIIVGAFDGNLYVFRHDGSTQPGFPVVIQDRSGYPDGVEPNFGRIFTTPAVGDVDGDGIPDIATGSNQLGYDENEGSVHLVHGDGNLHAGGPFHRNWPIRMSSFSFLPLVGEGVTSPASMARVGGQNAVAFAGTGNPTVQILPADQPARAPGEDPMRIVTLDSNGRGRLTDVTEPYDKPLFNVFATPSFGDLDQDGEPEFITSGAGFRLALSLGGGSRRLPFSHQLGAWSTTTGEMLPGFPRIIEDYTFFQNPSVADVSGDDYPEVIVGTGGYYVHAFDGCGREAEGFPKFTNGWIIASTALGDVDGDGTLEVVTATRTGYLFAWRTRGTPTGPVLWESFHHDNRNTGNYETELSQGVRLAADEPLDCTPLFPPDPDAGPSDDDAGPDDDDAGSAADMGSARPDTGMPGGGPSGDGGCCSVAGQRQSDTRGACAVAGLLALVGIAMGRARARRRSR